MKLSITWLREMVDLPDDVERLCEDLTTLGLEVESIEDVSERFEGVVVGHVLERKQHPNADRLSLCRVTTGDEEFPVVCGAPNVREGLKIAFATPGTRMPGDFVIKKAKIRGEVSLGMICSESELGLGDGHDGILELDDGVEIGSPLEKLFGYQDHCIEIEVTPNRPDWLGHIGVARELAALYRKPLRLPDAGDAVELVAEDDGWRARIDDAQACPRYTGRLVNGVAIGPSPLWMQRRLKAIGQRPINAVVDCSNYVLHECGQPNHVFDRARLHGREIILRKPAPGESMGTLDGQQRALQPHHLVVADAQGAVALAGVMGGEGSQVSLETTDLLLEVADFDQATVRRMRRDLSMSTDASYRFERGVDFEGVVWASRRLATLLLQCCGGNASPRVFDGRGTARPARAEFFVRAAKVRRVLGVEVPLDAMKAMLDRLEIPAALDELEGEPGLRVRQPSFRHDVLEEIDIVEEIARHYGYDKIPVEARAPMLRPAERTARERLRNHLRNHLSATGFHEVMGSSFMESADPDRLLLGRGDRRRQTLEVLNPLVVGEGHLKTSSLPEMLRAADRNRRHGHTGPLRLYQLDRCFWPRAGESLPEEPEGLVLLLAGPAQPAHVDRPERSADFWDLAGELELVLETLGIAPRREMAGGEAYHAPGTAAALLSDELVLGRMGVLHPKCSKAFDLDEEIVVAELDLEAIAAARPSERRFAPYSVYPPVRRDLSLLVPERVPFGSIEELVRRLAGDLLESVDVFDRYQGEGIPAGLRVLGLRMVLRSAQGTLKDRRVDALITKLLDELAESLQVRLRSA